MRAASKVVLKSVILKMLKLAWSKSLPFLVKEVV